jgi:uncharacterized protein with PIN domain
VPTNIKIRFYEELNDFLPRSKRKNTLDHSFFGTPDIKDIIESLGIPHTEVDLILVKGEPAGFDYKPSENDYISVYPVFESIDISGINRLRPKPLREPRFIADVHLGKLARYLRMLGFDTLYENDLEDDMIIRISSEEQRIILTRDLVMLKNGQVTHGYFVRSVRPADQIMEVIRRFDLKSRIRPFERCITCNGLIERIEKDKVKNLLRPKTVAFFNEFYQCAGCEKVYWQGSHFERMNKIIEKYMN